MAVATPLSDTLPKTPFIYSAVREIAPECELCGILGDETDQAAW